MTCAGQPLGFGFRLAWRFTLHQWPSTVILGCALGAITAPLLLLLALKTGFVADLRERLLNDPQNLEIRFARNEHLTQAWFTRYRNCPDVAFVLPSTRRFDAKITLRSSGGAMLNAVALIPSAPGDPLLPPALSAPRRPDQVVLSGETARHLQVSRGDRLQGQIERFGRQAGTASLEFDVIGVLAPATLSGEAVLADLDILVFTEDFRGGALSIPVNAEALQGLSASREAFAGARLYARDLDAVPRLSRVIATEGIAVISQSATIEGVRRLADALSLLFAIILGTVCVGAAVVLGAALATSLDRQQRCLALLRLYGTQDDLLWTFPLLQGLSAFVIALLIAALLQMVGAAVLQSVRVGGTAIPLAWGGLKPSELGGGVMLGLVISLMASALAGRRLMRAEPATALRRR